MPQYNPPKPEVLNRLNDTFVKFIFAREEHKAFVLSLINGIFAAKGTQQIEDFNFLGTEQNPERQKGKGARLDIVGSCSDGTTVNIEIQVEPLKNMVDRSLFYWSRLFPTINSGEDYTGLKRTVCINILAHSIFSDELAPSYCNTFLFINKDNPKHILTDKAQIFFLELDKFAKAMPDVSNMTLMDKWSAYLSSRTPQATLEAIAKSEPLIQQALNAEDTFMNTAALLNFYYDDERERRDRAARESYVREEGWAEGRAEGRAEGMIRMAREFGLSDAEIIQRLASHLNYSQQEASGIFQKYVHEA